jgi:hypothetical protein
VGAHPTRFYKDIFGSGMGVEIKPTGAESCFSCAYEKLHITKPGRVRKP